MNTNYTLTGLSTEKPFWYQQDDLGQNRTLRGGQLVKDFDAANNCLQNVTTVNAVSLLDHVPSFLLDDFENHFKLVIHLTSMQDAAEIYRHPEQLGKPKEP